MDEVHNIERSKRAYSITKIVDENGTLEIDNKPVEMFMDNLSIDCSFKEKSRSPIEYIQDIKKMDKGQLQSLASQLLYETLRFAGLWHSSFSKDHEKTVSQLRDLRNIAKKSGIDLWPELE